MHPPEFTALRETSFAGFDRARWDAYFDAMVRYLTHADADVRQQTIERLSMAALSAEPSDIHATSDGAANTRVRWLIEQLEVAHQIHRDVLPAFMSELRFKGHDAGQRELISAWLKALLTVQYANIDAHVVRGTLVLLEVFDSDSASDVARMVARLDDDSDYVRACAARRLSAMDGDALNEQAMFDIVQQKEIERPGIAGPFWSEWHFDATRAPVDAVSWVMHMLEQRRGPLPRDMPFNDIEFYLHELCAHAPNRVQRMIEGQFIQLAIETATETSGPVKGMDRMLWQLAEYVHPAIALRAQLHLARYYGQLHPLAPKNRIQKRVDKLANVRVFCFFEAQAQYASHVVWYPNAEDENVELAVIENEIAWSLIERVLPSELRGDLVRHYLDYAAAAPRSFRLGNQLIFRYASYAQIEFTGNVERQQWQRIEITAARLADRWQAFAKEK